MRARSWLPPSLSLLLCGVVRADGEDGDLRPRYVFDTDASKPGNCATYLDSLQKSYSEAADAANAAIEAINDLQQKMPEAWEPQDRQQWVRKADMFAAMFGIPVDKSTGLQLSNDLVTRVHSHFEDEYEDTRALKPDDDAAKDGKYRLFCSDGWLEQWVGPDDTVPEGDTVNRKQGEEPPKFKDTDDGKTFPEGAWFTSLSKEPLMHGRQYWKFNTDPGKRPCDVDTNGDHTLASTVQNPWRILTFCEYTFENFKKHLSDLKTTVKAGDSIETAINTLSGTWLHEWGHLVNTPPLDDLQAVDENGVDKTDENGKPILIYGFDNCVLSHFGTTKLFNPFGNPPEIELPRSVATPETFAYFAVAMYLSNFKWAEGTAETLLRSGS